MNDQKRNWDSIPSIENLEVDWGFEPENSLGKRVFERILNQKLFFLLGVKKVSVKIVAVDVDKTGQLVDISQSGIAVLLSQSFDIDDPVKIGFLLKRKKIISRAIVKNLTKVNGNYRIGFQFVALPQDAKDYIRSLISSQIHTT